MKIILLLVLVLKLSRVLPACTHRVRLVATGDSVAAIRCRFEIILLPLSLFRHSAKVVKAASQVLSSMWQYRDLRSLYKKVSVV